MLFVVLIRYRKEFFLGERKDSISFLSTQIVSNINENEEKQLEIVEFINKKKEKLFYNFFFIGVEFL